ncbi:MAG: TlpA family protein disulfide reductase [Flavobacteriaceae bacterium]
MKRGRIVNIFLLIFLALILFTPLGFHVKVFVNRIISFSPAPIEERKQEILESYDWRFQNRQGGEFNLSEAEGKVVLINFWATWCPPCVAEMPDLNELYQDYSDEVVFLFVARDKKSSVDTFMKKHTYDLPVYFEKGTTPVQLQTNSLPTTYILDKKRTIIVAKTGAASWNSTTTRRLIDGLINQ